MPSLGILLFIRMEVEVGVMLKVFDGVGICVVMSPVGGCNGKLIAGVDGAVTGIWIRTLGLAIINTSILPLC